MKEIKAYIQPHKLTEISLALHRVEGFTGISVMDIRGCGRGRENNGKNKVSQEVIDFEPHVKIEIVCDDEFVDSIVTAILENAHTGLRGDGKIYISTIDETIRISTGERGKDTTF